MKPLLLIIEDDQDICSQLKWALADSYSILLAHDPVAALAAFSTHQPRLVLLDLGLPPSPNLPTEGLALLPKLLAIDPTVKIIIASGQSEKSTALQAVGSGAHDFLPKPIDLDELSLVLRRSLSLDLLEQEFLALQKPSTLSPFENIIGSSPQMQAVFAFIRKVAASSAPVLILGESGTGKELVAKAIHQRSPQKDQPFIPINCNAIPENLLESELFGHEKGAFTGATAQRKGLIESAANGTLFLDEIGELPPQIQVKLLRFLQDKRFQPIGSRKELSSNARIIAATNSHLQNSVANGAFREDLYFRLAVVVISLPPLRDRADDVLLVANEFLHRYSAENAKTSLSFSADALRALSLHSWPGNIRELQNRVQRAVIMADSKRISSLDLELDHLLHSLPPQTLKAARESAERDAILLALKRHRHKISAAAEDLGISRPTLYELLEKLQIPNAKP